jgi:hypothetical protein
MTVLEPNHQLRWALQELPTPGAESEITARVPAVDDGAEIAIVLRRGERTHAGVRVAGWVYEGELRIPETDQSAAGGFPGIEAWLRGQLGPYCLDLEVLEQKVGIARVRVFATSRAALDRLEQ